ncbi:MAG: LolA-like putative outer membrane lipoprotein chaperone [Prevotella sp.]|jgi:outer membrane lipoprotein-sorting protein
MKTKLMILCWVLMLTLGSYAQNSAQARKILDKTASVVGRRGGASASFTVSSPKIKATSGTLAIKGNKFHATTPQAIVWYNGKTQWTYMKNTNEVNISTPTEAKRMRMNPYTFLTMYKQGYNLSYQRKGSNYLVHMVAQNKKRSVQEVYITVNSKTSIPSKISMREGSNWTQISIRNFKSKNIPNSTFTFRSKDFPKAEIVDLR